MQRNVDLMRELRNVNRRQWFDAVANRVGQKFAKKDLNRPLTQLAALASRVSAQFPNVPGLSDVPAALARMIVPEIETVPIESRSQGLFAEIGETLARLEEALAHLKNLAVPVHSVVEEQKDTFEKSAALLAEAFSSSDDINATSGLLAEVADVHQRGQSAYTELLGDQYQWFLPPEERRLFPRLFTALRKFEEAAKELRTAIEMFDRALFEPAPSAEQTK